MSKEKDKYFEGYSLFNLCEDKVTQAYNRIITYWTIVCDVGKAKASAYFKAIDKEDHVEIKRLLGVMEKDGMSELRRKVIAGQI